MLVHPYLDYFIEQKSKKIYDIFSPKRSAISILDHHKLHCGMQNLCNVLYE